MRDKIKQLKESRATVWSEAEAFLAEDRAEGFSAEDQTKWEAYQAELEARGREIEAAERLYNEAVATATVVDGDEGRGSDAHSDEARSEAFRDYLLNGERMSDSSRAILRTQDTLQNAQGGYTVTPTFLSKITETMQAFGGAVPLTNQISTDNGSELIWLTSSNNTAAAKGSIITEGATVKDGAEVSFGRATLGAYMYESGEVSVSYQLLQDSNIDIVAYLATQLGRRLARIKNEHVTSGTGTDQPDGIITGAVTGVTTEAGATAPTIDDMLALIHSVDPAYRGSAGRFMFNDATLLALRTLKDADGRPMWEPSVQVGEPDRYLGVPYAINQDMGNFGTAGEVPIAYGDFNAGYVTRTVNGISVVSHDLNVRKLQKSWFAISRWDGTKDDTSAYKVMVVG